MSPGKEHAEANASEFNAAVIEYLDGGKLKSATPHSVAAALEKRHGRDWIVQAFTSELDAAVERKISSILSQRRRTAERQASSQATTRTVRTGHGRSVREQLVATIPVTSLAEQLVQIPARGEWIRYADCTEADLRSRAERYLNIAGANSARADWCFAVIAQMKAEGVLVLGELSSLPPLPDGMIGEEGAAA